MQTLVAIVAFDTRLRYCAGNYEQEASRRLDRESVFLAQSQLP